MEPLGIYSHRGIEFSVSGEKVEDKTEAKGRSVSYKFHLTDNYGRTHETLCHGFVAAGSPAISERLSMASAWETGWRSFTMMMDTSDVRQMQEEDDPADWWKKND